MTSFCRSNLSRRRLSGVFWIALSSSVRSASRISRSAYDVESTLVIFCDSAFDLDPGVAPFGTGRFSSRLSISVVMLYVEPFIMMEQTNADRVTRQRGGGLGGVCFVRQRHIPRVVPCLKAESRTLPPVRHLLPQVTICYHYSSYLSGGYRVPCSTCA